MSRPAVVIAQAGVALGLAVMIVTVCVSLGFKHQIRSKVVGFNAHIHVCSLDAAQSFDADPIEANDSLLLSLNALPDVRHVQRYATRPGILRTGDDFLGFVLKGIGEEYDMSFFASYLQEGTIDSVAVVGSGALLISRSMADKLGYSVGDRVDAYFFGDNIRARRFTVCGIYQTGFGDFDDLFAVTALPTVQRLCDWESDEVAGVEIALSDYGRLLPAAYAVSNYLETYGEENQTGYYVQTIEEQNPNLFAWLAVLDTNVWLILLLMLGVAGFTVISGLLILILERMSLIGTLKALGSPNVSIRRTFLYLSAYIIGRGMMWGNIVGLGICALQYFTHLLPLDPANYYLDCVPIEFNWLFLVLLNIAMLILSVAMLILPSQLISRISPSKVIRFE